MGHSNSIDGAEASAIPIVDFAKWDSNASLEQKKYIANQLVDACKNVGFVYIVNHQVSPERLREAFAWSKKLFDLKLEEKMLAPHPNGSAVHRGYSWPGLEKVSNLMGDEEDPDAAKKERAITDVKVEIISLFLYLSLSPPPVLRKPADQSCRKATKSAAKATRTNQTSGCRRRSCRASENSQPISTGSATKRRPSSSGPWPWASASQTRNTFSHPIPAITTSCGCCTTRRCRPQI